MEPLLKKPEFGDPGEYGRWSESEAGLMFTATNAEITKNNLLAESANKAADEAHQVRFVFVQLPAIPTQVKLKQAAAVNASKHLVENVGKVGALVVNVPISCISGCRPGPSTLDGYVPCFGDGPHDERSHQPIPLDPFLRRWQVLRREDLVRAAAPAVYAEASSRWAHYNHTRAHRQHLHRDLWSVARAAGPSLFDLFPRPPLARVMQT